MPAEVSHHVSRVKLGVASIDEQEGPRSERIEWQFGESLNDLETGFGLRGSGGIPYCFVEF